MSRGWFDEKIVSTVEDDRGLRGTRNLVRYRCHMKQDMIGLAGLSRRLPTYVSDIEKCIRQLNDVERLKWCVPPKELWPWHRDLRATVGWYMDQIAAATKGVRAVSDVYLTAKNAKKCMTWGRYEAMRHWLQTLLSLLPEAGGRCDERSMDLHRRFTESGSSPELERKVEEWFEQRKWQTTGAPAGEPFDRSLSIAYSMSWTWGPRREWVHVLDQRADFRPDGGEAKEEKG